MSIIATWDDEAKTIICWEFSADWSWYETSLTADQTRQMMEHPAAGAAIAIIMVMDTVETIPRDSLRNMRRLLQYLRDKDIVILSGSNAAVNVMTAFMRATFGNAAARLFTAASLEEARTLAKRLLQTALTDADTRPNRTVSDT
jgi:hypothetical protein